MRAVSLVRVWLYGVRGFIAMTISLAIAFSWAVTGPPTNTEIDLVSDAVATKAEAFGAEIEAAAIQLCPSLPEELRMLCSAPASPAEEAPAVEAPPKPPPVVELVVAEASAAEPIPSVSEAQLLGGPAPRVRPERAQAPRTTTQRASARRPATNQRVEPPRRASAQRRAPTARVVAQRPAPDRALAERIRAAQQAAQGDLSRAVVAASRDQSQARPDPTPAVSRGDDSDSMHRELQRAAEAYRERADESDNYQAIEEERRARREERRRRRLEQERAYEAAREREYYEEDADPEAEEYPAEIW
jgi:hypothetical protein